MSKMLPNFLLEINEYRWSIGASLVRGSDNTRLQVVTLLRAKEHIHVLSYCSVESSRSS